MFDRDFLKQQYPFDSNELDTLIEKGLFPAPKVRTGYIGRKQSTLEEWSNEQTMQWFDDVLAKFRSDKGHYIRQFRDEVIRSMMPVDFSEIHGAFRLDFDGFCSALELPAEQVRKLQKRKVLPQGKMNADAVESYQMAWIYEFDRQVIKAFSSDHFKLMQRAVMNLPQR